VSTGLRTLKKHPAVIFDIDGTLACCEHRRHHVVGPEKDWDAFFAAIEEDRPKKLVVDLLNFMCSSNFDVLLVTGRGEDLRARTEQWLDDNAIHFDKLLMRSEGDFRPDTTIKTEIYRQYIEPFYDVHLVVDDRDSVVKNWRCLGLECWQVAEGNF